MHASYIISFVFLKEMEYQLREQMKINHDLEESERKQIQHNEELLKHYEEKEAHVFEYIRKRYNN